MLCLNVPIARTGMMEYGAGETPLEVGPNGIVKITREKSEVFRPQTIASFQGKSVTIKHPEDFVAPENWQDLTHGVVQNVRASDEKDDDGEDVVLADLLITSKMAIGLVNNGLREVSCGYEAEYEQTGEGEGKQLNIVGNHIALVEQGRAGTAYAINDHKREEDLDMKTLAEIKAALLSLGKTIDEASAGQTASTKKDEMVKDKEAYDELIKAVKDLSDKVEGMKSGKDEDKPAKKDDKDAKDEDEEESEDDEESSSVEERLKTLEAAIAKLLESKDDDEDGDESEDEEEEESSDDDEDMSGESEDDDEDKDDKKGKTGDAARVEILAPGYKPAKGADAKKESLKRAYDTKDGKAAIHLITGGKKPNFASKEAVEGLFMAVSEILKSKRGTGLEGTKNGRDFKAFDSDSKKEPVTPEKMNELNAAHWAAKK